jgi:predicted amidohydrolase
MKVAVYQTNPTLLDIKANLEDVISKIHQGKEKGAQLIAFPELALTGYFVGHRYHEAALRLDSNEIQKLVAATQGTAAVVGFIEESPAMNFYNSALVAVDGRILFAYRKLNLPNYGVFEERKYFASGKWVPVFKLHDLTIAIFICNDMWHPSVPYLGICQKADVFVTILNSAEESMGMEFSNIESWEIINKFYSRIFGIYNIVSNRVGEESYDEEAPSLKETVGHPGVPRRFNCRFWGGSEIVNPFGLGEAKAAMYKEDELFGEISRDLLRRKKIILPYLRGDDPFFTYRELDRILYGKLKESPEES